MAGVRIVEPRPRCGSELRIVERPASAPLTLLRGPLFDERHRDERCDANDHDAGHDDAGRSRARLPGNRTAVQRAIGLPDDRCRGDQRREDKEVRCTPGSATHTESVRSTRTEELVTKPNA